MPNFPPDSIHALLSGQRNGLAPSLLRFALSVAEPFYSAAVACRNRLFDRGIRKSHKLPVPVISVGNITAGGTGKTPVVRFLANRFREMGLHPAILLRGYKAAGAERSDEEQMLRDYLHDKHNPIPVHANPDRVFGGREILAQYPETNLVLLDDGFQHRRLHRDFDLVLIDATNPFGFDHVHPRGLLREPISGLRRADAFIISRTDLISADDLQKIEETLRGHNRHAPIYRTRHVHTGFRSSEALFSAPANIRLEGLAKRRFFAAAGIGNPSALQQQLKNLPGQFMGAHFYPDHHTFTEIDLAQLKKEAQDHDANLLLVTEKDWTKISRLQWLTLGLPIWRIELDLQFDPPAPDGLIQLIQARLDAAR